MKKSELLLTASVMTAFLGFGYNMPEVRAETMTSQNDEYKSDSVYETKDWNRAADKWDSIEKVKAEEFNEIYDIVNKEKEKMDEILTELVADGYFSQVTADAINYIYGENLTASLESQVILPCCYAPVPPPPDWDCTGIDTREGLEKKLVLVNSLYDSGTVDMEVLDSAKKDILQRISLLDRGDEYWKSKGDGTLEDHSYEVDLLLHLYDRNSGGIKEGKDVQLDLIKASEYIYELEN